MATARKRKIYKGYWWNGEKRAYYATEGRRKVRLLDENNEPIREEANREAAKKAYAHYLVQRDQAKRQQVTALDATLSAICATYLTHCEREDRSTTYSVRVNHLYDFCEGLPCRFRTKEVGSDASAHRIHQGFGPVALKDFQRTDVQAWLRAHPSWGPGTKRMAVQALKRAINFYLEGQNLAKSQNPIYGFKAGRAAKRVTYFSQEQQAAIRAASKPDFWLFFNTSIETGARYGSELAKLTARHIEECPDRGQRWRFAPNESKNHKERIIYVPANIAETVRQLRQQYPTGPLFRNSKGQPWTLAALQTTFRRLKARLANRGIQLDDDACLYSARHTFAQRKCAQGVSIEILSQLMGNTRQVCWEHYAQFATNYQDPLWRAVGTIDAPSRTT